MFSLVLFNPMVNTYAPLTYLHLRDQFGLIFLAVTNAFTVNKKKLLICITDKAEETFF